MKIRSIAFVLPQFHPIPENDLWWGKGFTDWTNVIKAEPLFKGHYQPRIPTMLGYYDLRQEVAREAQANLAKKYGIYGFCYYHYWFNSKRLLNYPIDEMLRLKKPDIPFMLCWANENWTRRWDGKDQDILIKQNYSSDDDKDHIRWLCKFVFTDKRYIKVNDCPVFIVYRDELLPNAKETANIWREIAVKEFGFKGLYLCTTESFRNVKDPSLINFDASIEFAPHQLIRHKLKESFFNKICCKLKIKKREVLNKRDYRKAVDLSLKRKIPSYKLYRCVSPSFDNTARKNTNGVIVVKSSPRQYYRWLKGIVYSFRKYSEDENFLFINAMNEWAEGNHLEPCKKYGLSYLRLTNKALKKTAEVGSK
ncbi:glycoside hydrolase family 99-like domain-containing protein [Snuella sedimenti]|uniref:Glycoside hydrolase family 99-like domain-containing protein n=1 Tax=Snuella sedimenti TaxID=2798802 RepID=A0A8J7LMR9_9FLAO|nr:glycoside hydrolase family 99-like domain-containing protein [Snuella sedimenti]MBJ6367899.1 glycoside hydrolase family 99-like domain-containing protein [Snuella sedimenti]